MVINGSPFKATFLSYELDEVVSLESSPLTLDLVPILDAVSVGLAIAIRHIINVTFHQCAEGLANLTVHLHVEELNDLLLHAELQLNNRPSLLQAL